MSIGIFQSDIIVRSAIEEAFADIRRNPWLLDWVFGNLLQDGLTTEIYGKKQIVEAKKWFLKTKIPVIPALSLAEPKLPCISLALIGTSESDVTLGDVNYDTHQDLEDDPEIIERFVPKSYDPKTGVIVIPASVAELLVLVPGMAVVDANGNRHEIIEVPTDFSVKIAVGAPIDFNAITFKYAMPVYKIEMESVGMKEDFLVGIHCNSPAHLFALHSILTFVMLRYKQALFEERGFERSVFSSTDFVKQTYMEVEAAYSRYMNLTGYVRQFWPKSVRPTFQTSRLQLQIDGAVNLPPDTPPATALWIGDEDDSLAAAATVVEGT